MLVGRHLAVRVRVHAEEKRWPANQKGKDEVGADGSNIQEQGKRRTSAPPRTSALQRGKEGRQEKGAGIELGGLQMQQERSEESPSNVVYFLWKLSPLSEE